MEKVKLAQFSDKETKDIHAALQKAMDNMDKSSVATGSADEEIIYSPPYEQPQSVYGQPQSGFVTLKGIKAFGGRVSGEIFKPEYDDEDGFKPGMILVANKTLPNYLPMMKQCVGIVTQYGGLMSHAAVVSRALAIPCVVGVTDLLSYNNLGYGDVHNLVVNADNAEVSFKHTIKKTVAPKKTLQKIKCDWCLCDDHEISDCCLCRWCDGCDEYVKVEHVHDWN